MLIAGYLYWNIENFPIGKVFIPDTQANDMELFTNLIVYAPTPTEGLRILLKSSEVAALIFPNTAEVSINVE